MTNSPDYPDYTTQVSRFMAQLTQSPASANTAGVQSQVFDVPTWARSINFLVTPVNNVITLTVTGTQTGFIYLNAVPAYDGGIYYVPAMPVIDTQITVTWYQVAATLVSIYGIASDEPISVSVFNPVSPTLAASERLLYGMPRNYPANALTALTFTIDATTVAVRVTVDTPANYLWGRVVGFNSGTVYFNGQATNTKFPVTPIPIDRSVDTQLTVTIQTVAGGAVNTYVTAVNVPDSSSSIPLTQPMAPNELSPDVRQSMVPNQLPVVFDGTIAASGNHLLTAAVAGQQYRLHQMTVYQYTAVATAFEVQDTSGTVYHRYHYGAAMNAVIIPLLGKPTGRGTGINLVNATAVLSGAIAVTLDYSVL